MSEPRKLLDQVFDPPEEEWVALSPNYYKLKRLRILTTYGFEAIAIGILLYLTTLWWISLIAVTLIAIWTLFRYLRMPRWAASWGYAERENDLFIRHGLFLRELLIVPYGRMQVIEINSGPFERHYGLASVKLVTASASTDAVIPGLEAKAAAALRERLASHGEAQAAGL